MTWKAEAFAQQDRISTSKSLAHYIMGQVYDLLGLTNQAIMEYEKAIESDQGSYLLHLRLGANYARVGLLPEAVNELAIVTKLNPEDLQSHYLLALIYSTQKDYAKAAEEYELILKSFSKIEPQNIEIYGYLGQLYYSQKKYHQAIEQFEKILTIESQNADVMYLLASLYLEVDNKNKAIELLQQSLKADPQHDGSLNTLAYVYAENNEKLDEALNLITQALTISPDNGAYLDSLGWVYYKKGMFEQALESLEKANSLLKDPVIFDHLGDVYLALNRAEEALKHWQLSLDLDPGQEEVKQKINNLQSSRASNATNNPSNP
jgi:tetratricopeptide (TPR) repeat protein